MMIGFDAKRAAQNKTGLGNYSRFIIEALTRFAPNERYLLYIPNPNRTSLLNGIEKANNVELRYPQTTFWKKFRSLWRVWGITSDIEKENIRLFHGLSNELPLNIRKAENTRSIVTIHDLIFLRYPEYYQYMHTSSVKPVRMPTGSSQSVNAPNGISYLSFIFPKKRSMLFIKDVMHNSSKQYPKIQRRKSEENTSFHNAIFYI